MMFLMIFRSPLFVSAQRLMFCGATRQMALSTLRFHNLAITSERCHIGVSNPKIGGFTPQIIHFNRVFHYFHHPFWGFPIIFGNIHIGVEPKIGGFYHPKWMVKIMEHPILKWMIWGVKTTPIFGSTPIYLTVLPGSLTASFPLKIL